MRINNNIMSMNSHRQLSTNNANGAKSMEKLSSGLRINRAGDDAAGLSISEKMRGQIRGLKQASRNAQDGISLIQTAEGALNETHSILQRMRELAVQANNETNNDDDIASIQKEANQLAREIDRIADNTQFNTKDLLALSGISVSFQIGSNSGQQIDLAIDGMTSAELLITASGTGETAVALAMEDANTITKINDAIQAVSDARSNLGSVQNRLEHTIANLDNSSENLQAAESRIRDVDMAAEMMDFTKNNILSQAATAMLAQANQAPQSVLQLLG